MLDKYRNVYMLDTETHTHHSLCQLSSLCESEPTLQPYLFCSVRAE